MNNNDSGMTKLSFILGLVAGAGLAAFLTPVSGKKLRNETVKRSKKMMNSAKNSYEDLKDEYVDPSLEYTKDKLNEVKEKAVETKNDLIAKADDVKSDVKKKVVSFRDRFTKE